MNVQAAAVLPGRRPRIPAQGDPGKGCDAGVRGASV